MNCGLVSIIMPSYNCGRYVEESIRSVQAQTYHNWEIIFVDDCSTDNTLSIVSAISALDSRVHVYCNDINLGAAAARNKALKESKGRWVAFLDSDDLWEPDKLEKQISFMEINHYAFSYTRYKEIDAESNPTGIIVSGPKHITKQGMYRFCWPGCLTVMYDSSKIGVIQINNIGKNNDYAMWLKIIQKDNCHLLDECLAQYRRGRVGSISSHSIVTMISWHYKLWKEAENNNAILASWHTLNNLIFGFYKKFKYVRKLDNGTHN